VTDSPDGVRERVCTSACSIFGESSLSEFCVSGCTERSSLTGASDCGGVRASVEEATLDVLSDMEDGLLVSEGEEGGRIVEKLVELAFVSESVAELLWLIYGLSSAAELMIWWTTNHTRLCANSLV
jgi:hypothetical protein